MSDPISREAAIEAIESHLRVGDEVYPLTRTDKILNHAFEIAVSCVYNLPTAERVGKWARHILKNANVPWGYDCSMCGKWFVIGEDSAENYNYCPNCGARMEGEENERENY